MQLNQLTIINRKPTLEGSGKPFRSLKKFTRSLHRTLFFWEFFLYLWRCFPETFFHHRVGSVDVMDTIASLSTTVNLIEHFLKIFFGAPGLIYPECFKKVNFLTVVPTEHVFVSRHGALMWYIADALHGVYPFLSMSVSYPEGVCRLVGGLLVTLRDNDYPQRRLFKKWTFCRRPSGQDAQKNKLFD